MWGRQWSVQQTLSDTCVTQHLWCFLDYSSWYFKYLLTGWSILLLFFIKLSFLLFMIRSFFLFIHFLIVENYELPKSTSHILSAPLTLECISFCLDPFFYFYFNCLSDDVLCKIAIWADYTALNSSCDKPSNLLQQVKPMSSNLILKIWKCKTIIQFCIQLYIDIWETTIYLQANPYQRKTKNIINLIFICTITK